MRRARGRGRKGSAWLAYLVGLPIALVVLAPFLYMVATALLGQGDRLGRAHPETFAAALAAAPFGRFFLNSAIFSGAVALGQVLTSTTAAYAFARLRFPGRDRLFVVYLSALNGRVFSGRSSRHPLSTCRCGRAGCRACTARTT